MKAKLVLLGCVLLAALLETARADPPNGDEKKLQGTWSIISVQTGSKALEGLEKKAAKNGTVVFAGSKVTFQGPDDKLEFSFKLDAGKSPKAIDLAESGKGTLKGIYSLDGDILKLCVADRAGNKRPTEFKTKTGTDGQGLCVLRRKKP